MAIVRNDRRDAALASVRELREGLQVCMRQLDSMQASLQDAELTLGLATEGEQAKRGDYLVMHYPEGAAVGHTLDECTDDCAAHDVIRELGAEEGDAEKGPGPAADES